MSKSKHIWKRREPEYKEAVGSRLVRWKRLKLAKLSEAQGHRCCYCCGETFLTQPDAPAPKGMVWKQRATIEHLIPQSQPVQTNKDENLVMACSWCNSLRGNNDPIEYYNALRRVKVLQPKAKIKGPEKLSAEKLLQLKEKEGRTLILCLVAFAMYPEEMAWYTDNWTPRIPRAEFKMRRPKQIRQIGLQMKEDSRRLAA